MGKIILFFFCFLQIFPIMGQDDFQFIKKKNRVSFSFQLVNNLVLVPLKINGVELTFLLDSGVAQTIVFSIDDQNDFEFKNTQKVLLKGFGSDYTVPGLKSTDNILEVKGMISRSHLLYIVLGEEFNFSEHLGVPVNGIMGYTFLKNNLVEINYSRHRITVYDDNNRNRKKIEAKFSKVPLSIEKNKPYLIGNVKLNGSVDSLKLLVDIGNSDSIWLFENEKVAIPNKNFEDYLGKGFSGDVFGKRAQIDEFRLLDFKFSNPIVAFPDSSSIKFLKFIPERMGSVGGEILKRFTVIMDYKNRAMYLKPNKMFKNPFLYNKSGLEIIHAGMKLVNIEDTRKSLLLKTATVFNLNVKNTSSNFKYKFELKPIYKIASVRLNSTAEKSGILKGDIIVSINKHTAESYSYQEIYAILKSENEKYITIEVIRNGKRHQFKFKLIDIL
ncbi:PDZ domain-containing protein [Flavobacterium ovatum]|uniref:PDZ domain-containing protein n=1 Tax=Flavobacterium ovatum TaxID=1928857 RepID=UPI00344F0456